MSQTILMHYNASLEHQRAHALAFIKGCPEVIVTDKVGGEADIHIISGNHFAYDKWKNHPRVLMISRAWWGDPDCVSIGWLQPNGSRKFAAGVAPRPKPLMESWKGPRECSCLIMADYGQDISDIVFEAKMRFITVHTRLHPADSKERHVTTTATALRLHDVAIGTGGTSVFESIRMGVPTICLDPTSECAPVCSDTIGGELYRGERSQWLHDMTYKQFSLAEITDGTAWSLLKDIQ